MAASKSSDKDKVFDVAKPGAVTPDENSRPLIVTRKTLAQDPMVKSSDTDEEAPNAKVPLAASAKKIEPTDGAKETLMPKEAEPPAAKSEDASKSSSSVDLPEEDDPQKEADSEAKKKAEAEAKERERLAHIEKLIEEKKYFVNISETKKQKAANKVVVVFVILLLLLVGAYLAVDAGVVQTSISLPVDLIKN